MDMINISSALGSVQQYDNMNSLPAAASMVMLDHAMDTNMEMGSSMIRMMELSVNPQVGSNFDMYA